MKKSEIELLSFPFDETDIENLQYALEVLVERHQADEWEAVGDKEENTEQYGKLVYLLCDLLGPKAKCSMVDPLLSENYYFWCLNNKKPYDEDITRQDVLVKFRSFN